MVNPTLCFIDFRHLHTCLCVHVTGGKERTEWGLWMSSELQSKELLECCKQSVNKPPWGSSKDHRAESYRYRGKLAQGFRWEQGLYRDPDWMSFMLHSSKEFVCPLPMAGKLEWAALEITDGFVWQRESQNKIAFRPLNGFFSLLLFRSIKTSEKYEKVNF